MLCEYILLLYTVEKVVYVTKGEQCFQKTGQGVIEILMLKSKHKEADHRIIHHTYFASRQHKSICIGADDTDVLIFLLYIYLEEVVVKYIFAKEHTRLRKEFHIMV